MSDPTIKEDYEQETEKYDLNLYTLNSLLSSEIPEPEWIIKNFIPKNSIVILGGDSGSLKTFTALHIALNISVGEPFLDSVPSEKNTVLYLDEENRGSILKARLDSLLTGHEIIGSENSLDNLYIAFSNALKIDGSEETSKVLINQLMQDIKPRLVVIDSLIRFTGGDENSATDMRKVFDFIKPLIEIHNCSFLILHHIRKNSSSKKADLRGSGDIHAMADLVFMITKNNPNTYSLEQVKNRYGEGVPPITFNLLNTQNKGLKLVYKGFKEERKTKPQAAKKDIINWIKEEDKADFTYHEVLKVMKTTHSDYAIKEALVNMQNEGLISNPKFGIYEIIN